MFGACILILVAAAHTLPVDAMEMTDLYTIQVPVDETESGWREQAYSRALSQVLIRVTGQRSAANDLQLEALFEQPSRLVQGYRRGADDTLWVSFDGRAIAAQLRQAGRAVWGSERPVTLVWLAVDRGRGEREIIAAEEDSLPASASRSADPNRFLRERVNGVAIERGIPVVWPLLDGADLEAIGFSDIWGGFEQPVIDASMRYSANSILVGRIDASGGANTPRWIWYFGGEQRQWRASVEDAVHRVADLMASQLAAVGDEQTTTVRLMVGGVSDLTAYADINRYLGSVSVIRSLELEQFLDDSLTYRLELLGESDRLARVLRLSGRFDPFEQASAQPLSDAPLELRVTYRR